jgi:UDP-glucose 4-epimerase
LKVFGNDYPTPDGTGVRDYIHIVDLAEGHVKAIDKLGDGGIKGFITYNLGTGTGYSVLDVVKGMETASGRKIAYEIAPRWVGQFIKLFISCDFFKKKKNLRRAGDVADVVADVKLAAVELGWKAKRGLKEMCEDTWRWQKTNPNGFSAKSQWCYFPKV